MSVSGGLAISQKLFCQPKKHIPALDLTKRMYSVKQKYVTPHRSTFSLMRGHSTTASSMQYIYHFSVWFIYPEKHVYAVGSEKIKLQGQTRKSAPVKKVSCCEPSPFFVENG